MHVETGVAQKRSVWGLILLVLGIGVPGVVTGIVATAYGVPGWLVDGLILFGIIIVPIYVVATYLPQRSLERELDATRDQCARSEATFRHALEHLQAGDVADTLSHTGELPDELATAFANAARALASLVQQIQNTSLEIAAAGQSVHATAAELASGSSEQAAAVVEITATMEELARTAGQIAVNAHAQADRAAQSQSAGDAGSVAVGDAVKGVEAVRERIDVIATRADALGTRSKEIYRVLDLITEIAQETHILSLNAAIEAATAGEHGRRFSVVADEVRRLAQRSRESVDSVRALLDDFAGSIRATIVATEEGSKEAARVLERARAAEGAIEELRDALSDTARAAREISLATEQHGAGSAQVVITLKEVSSVIQRMAEGLRHFSATAERLNQLALSIQLLTQSFHLDSPRSLKHVAERWSNELAASAGHWESVGTLIEGVVREEPFLEMAFLVDARGNMVAFALNREAVGEHELPAAIRLGATFTDRPWFQTVTREGRPILTPVYDSLLTGERCFTVATPVRTSQGELVGVLGLDVNARNWTKI